MFSRRKGLLAAAVLTAGLAGQPVAAQTTGPCRSAIDHHLQAHYRLNLGQLADIDWGPVDTGRFIPPEIAEVRFAGRPPMCSDGALVLMLHRSTCQVFDDYTTGGCRVAARS
jgi:hypothetical protein